MLTFNLMFQTPTEVQGILGEIEKEAEQEQLNFNGNGFE